MPPRFDPPFSPRHRLSILPALVALAIAGAGCRPRSAFLVPPRPPLPDRIQFTDGSRTWRIAAEKVGLNPYRHRLDLAKAAVALKAIAGMANVPKRDASLLFTPTGLRTTPSRESLSVDLANSLHRLVDYVSSANPPKSVLLAVKIAPPHIEESELKKIDGVLAEFVTHYNGGDRARTQNVRLVTQGLNGGIALPGETFSFNGQVGPRDPKKGFKIAHVYVRGKMIEDVGGGTCQVSSTLYNAVLLAGMKIVERSNHSLTVPYVKPGRDATVYFGQRDFKFKNNTKAPIYIRAAASGGRLSIALYGQKREGPKIEIVSDSHRRGDKIYAHAYRLYIEDGRVIRREHLSSDSYVPLALAARSKRRFKAPAAKPAVPTAPPSATPSPAAEAVRVGYGG